MSCMRSAAPLCLLCLAACSSSARRDAAAPDTGPDAASPDAPSPADSGTDARFDAGSDTGPGDCSSIAGYRRCDVCTEPCPRPATWCEDDRGVCVPRDRDYCSYGLQHAWGIVCGTGRPCAVGRDPDRNPDDFGGPCVSVDFCLASADAGLPPFECVYPDLTPVTRPPPAAECPASNPRAPFCAGACGTVECPVTTEPAVIPPGATRELERACVGLSDTRGFGVCAYAGYQCNQRHIDMWLGLCRGFYDEDCACMVTRPRSPWVEEDFGFLVLGSACRAYRDVYPDSIECHGAGWIEL